MGAPEKDGQRMSPYTNAAGAHLFPCLSISILVRKPDDDEDEDDAVEDCNPDIIIEVLGDPSGGLAVPLSPARDRLIAFKLLEAADHMDPKGGTRQ